MPPRNIILIGFMGAGKTTVGRVLAERLGWSFVDTDARIVRDAAGRPIPLLFAEEGETAFRDRETRALRDVCLSGRQVISTGGGIVVRPENIACLRSGNWVVWLTARPQVVVERTRARASERPLLAGRTSSDADLLTHVLTLLGERGPLYQAAAHCIVDTSDRPPRAIAAEIARKAERSAGNAGQTL